MAPFGDFQIQPKGISRRTSGYSHINGHQKVRFGTRKSVFCTQWRIFGIHRATWVAHGGSQKFRDFRGFGRAWGSLGSLNGPQAPYSAPFGDFEILPKGILRRNPGHSHVNKRQKNAFQDQQKCFLDAIENIWGPSGHLGGTWWKSKNSRVSRFWARLGVPGVPEWASGAVFGDLW